MLTTVMELYIVEHTCLAYTQIYTCIFITPKTTRLALLYKDVINLWEVCMFTITRSSTKAFVFNSNDCYDYSCTFLTFSELTLRPMHVQVTVYIQLYPV